MTEQLQKAQNQVTRLAFLFSKFDRVNSPLRPLYGFLFLTHLLSKRLRYASKCLKLGPLHIFPISDSTHPFPLAIFDLRLKTEFSVFLKKEEKDTSPTHFLSRNCLLKTNTPSPPPPSPRRSPSAIHNFTVFCWGFFFFFFRNPFVPNGFEPLQEKIELLDASVLFVGLVFVFVCLVGFFGGFFLFFLLCFLLLWLAGLFVFLFFVFFALLCCCFLLLRMIFQSHSCQ